MITETCPHKESGECRVWKFYKELCYLNFTDEQKKAFGNECAVAEEYEHVPTEPLVRPNGLGHGSFSDLNRIVESEGEQGR